MTAANKKKAKRMNRRARRAARRLREAAVAPAERKPT